MREFYVIREHDSDDYSCHYDEKSAREVISKARYVDRSGSMMEGKEHWTAEQIEAATSAMKFPAETTKWDKYVAFNSMYFDLCRVLDDALVLKTAHAFFFADEDYEHKQSKIKRYMDCMAI